MTGLTRKQLELLVFVHGYAKRCGFSPNYKEIAAGIGLSAKSKGVIAGYVTRLEQRGLMIRIAKSARSITLTDEGARLATQFADRSSVAA